MQTFCIIERKERYGMDVISLRLISSILPLRVRAGIEEPSGALVHPKPKALARVAGIGRSPTALVGPASTSTAAERRRILHRRSTGRKLIGHIGHVTDAIARRRRRVDAGEG